MEEIQPTRTRATDTFDYSLTLKIDGESLNFVIVWSFNLFFDFFASKLNYIIK